MEWQAAVTGKRSRMFGINPSGWMPVLFASVNFKTSGAGVYWEPFGGLLWNA